MCVGLSIDINYKIRVFHYVSSSSSPLAFSSYTLSLSSYTFVFCCVCQKNALRSLHILLRFVVNKTQQCTCVCEWVNHLLTWWCHILYRVSEQRTSVCALSVSPKSWWEKWKVFVFNNHGWHTTTTEKTHISKAKHRIKEKVNVSNTLTYITLGFVHLECVLHAT